MKTHEIRKFFLILASLMFITTSFGVVGQTSGDRLLTRVALFRGNQSLNSNASWVPVGNFSLPQATLVRGSAPVEQKWRLKIAYRVDQPGSRFALQARVDLNQTQSPTFSVAWDDARTGRRQAFTNWLQPDTLGFDSATRFPVSLNLIPSNDGKPSAAIYLESVELEIWEIVAQEQRTGAQIASVANPAERSSTLRAQGAKRSGTAQAIEASINFLRAASTGGLTAAKPFLSEQIISLTDLTPMANTRVPLLKLPSGMTFDEYLANYEPQVFSYSQFAGLFDDLESHEVNGWQLSPKSYLFIGNNTKSWGKDVLPGQPLVFILEEENGSMKIKAFP
ncbi:MAG: hypothetical protein ACRCVN_06890 [Spirochaetia bacterium]